MHNSQIKVGDRVRFVNPDYPLFFGVIGNVTRIDYNAVELDARCPRTDRPFKFGPENLRLDTVGNNTVRAVEGQHTAFKADTGKTRWTLLLDCARGCGRAVRAVVRVLNFAVRSIAEGGKGYIPHSWREVPGARERYEDALHRHLDCIRDGETHDAESGESHWAHVATNALFLWELDNPKEKPDE